MRKILLLMMLFSFSLAKAQMKRIATSPTAITTQIPGYSQVSTITTKTYSYTPSTPPTPPTPIDEDSTTEDGHLYRYADLMSVSINMADGNITSTTIGKVWTLRISIPNALNVGFVFNQFNLSSTAEMYVFDEARTVLDSGIKQSHFTSTTQVGIFPIKGNAAIIYIVEPNNFGTLQSSVAIQTLEAGFREVADIGEDLTESINCNPHVRCQNHRMGSARAVARFATNGHLCTGTLLNNENNNGRAFFLTAFHCIDVGGTNNVIDASEEAALANGRFQFQFWRTACNGNVNNAGIQFTGAVLRASWKNSDVVLLELSNPPGVGDGVNYAGWSRQTSAPDDYGSYIIHHPEGEDMRITTTRKVKDWLWNNMFWTAKYNSGTVTGGSSGSALFNENGQVVGQLKGGWSSCTFTDFGDRYGKFNHSWNGAGLQTWLSPTLGLNATNTLVLSPLTIAGETYFTCPSPDITYTVPNLLGCTYSWTHSANLMLVSGQNTSTAVFRSISALPTDFGWIEVTITDSKGFNRVVTARKDVEMGLPLVEGVRFTNTANSDQYFCTSHYGNEFEPLFTNIPSSSGIEYRVLSWPSLTLVYTDPGLYPTGSPIPMNYMGTPGSYVVVEIRLTTPCGTSPWMGYEVEFVDCSMMKNSGQFDVKASPNPVSDNLYVTLENESAEVKTLKRSENVKFALYDFNRGRLVKQWSFGNDQKGYKLNVTGIRAGKYILVVTKGKYRQSTHIIID
jgi:hypothetical protein